MASSLASAGSNASNNIVQFRRPIVTEDNHHDNNNTIFPPVVYTDATYSRGILVANANDATNNAAAAAGNEHDLETVSISIPNDYFVNNNNAGQSNYISDVLPRLSADEAARWADSHAAHAAAKRRSPMQIGRLLGTISLGFEERVSAVHDI